MAVYKSIATGGWLTAATWGLVDSTSYNNTETTTTALTTSYQESTGATTGVITVDGVAVKLSVRTGTTGTITVHLAIATVEVPGTAVTINTADLPVAATADLNGGWIYFKFASPVVLAGATSYTVGAKTSSASQVSLFSTATTNWARALVTTTTANPTTGDDLIIAGEYLSAGSSNTFTVTMNETATTDYGGASTSLVLPAVAICSKGTLTFGSTAATNYNLKQSGNMIVYSGGTLNHCTSGTPLPSGSTITHLFDSAANVDFGLTVRNLGTWNGQGPTKTLKALLAADAAAAATALTTNVSTGWKNGDTIALASTTRTNTEAESKALGADASGTSIPTIAALTNAHSGTSPTQAELILLNQAIKITGASSSLQGYIDIKATSTVAIQYIEFTFMGSVTANKRGLDVATTTGSFNMRFCSVHDFTVANSISFNQTGASSNNIICSDNVFYNNHTQGISIPTTTGTSLTFDSNWLIKNTSGDLLVLADYGGTITNNVMVSATSRGILWNATEAITGTISGNTVHSNGAGGLQAVANPTSGTITNTTIWRNASFGWLLGAGWQNIIFDGITAFGNATAGIDLGTNVSNLLFKNVTSNGGVTLVQPAAFRVTTQGAATEVYIEGSSLGATTAHSTGDVNIAGIAITRIFLRNTLMSSTTEVATQSNLLATSIVASDKHDQTANNFKSWGEYGTTTIDTTITKTSPQSTRLTPNNASFKYTTGFKSVSLNSGQTATFTVWVRASVVGDGTAYNGNRIRLMLQTNAAMGITSDTVGATATVASVGAFEQLTYTTPAAGEAGVFYLYCDCDGTTGWVNIADWTVNTTNDSGTEKYWINGQTALTLGGSGGGATTNIFIHTE